MQMDIHDTTNDIQYKIKLFKPKKLDCLFVLTDIFSDYTVRK